MIDLHCHLIYETDDGAKSLDDSIAILREAYQAGFDKICCTPHYAPPQYMKTKDENKVKLEIMKEKLKEENINVELFLGNEIYVSDNMKELLDAGKISTLADTDYVLVELPLTQKLLGAEEMVAELVYNGYKVILAHPERYMYVHKNLKYLDEFLERGVYLQGNYESLIGKYGRDSEKTLKKLLKEQKIDYLSSDVHRQNSTYTKMEKILKALKHYAKNDYFENITVGFQEKILKNL